MKEASTKKFSQSKRSEIVRVNVDPGICGFLCSISSWKENKSVKFEILSACGLINEFATTLGSVQMKDLFHPITKSPIFLCAEAAKCHLACPIPSALVKSAEIVLDLALPKDASIRFQADR